MLIWSQMLLRCKTAISNQNAAINRKWPLDSEQCSHCGSFIGNDMFPPLLTELSTLPQVDRCVRFPSTRLSSALSHLFHSSPFSFHFSTSHWCTFSPTHPLPPYCCILSFGSAGPGCYCLCWINWFSFNRVSASRDSLLHIEVNLLFFFALSFRRSSCGSHCHQSALSASS